MRVKPREIILEYKREGFKAYPTAFKLGIHPVTVYRWVKRATIRPNFVSSLRLKRKSTKPSRIKRFEFTPNQKLQIEELRIKKNPDFLAAKYTSQTQV